MRTKPFFILLIIFLLGSKIYAQPETSRLIITDGLNNPGVKALIEQNTSLLLTALKKAKIEGENLDLSNISISSGASKILLSLWETSIMSCPDSIIQRKCLQCLQGGYQVRDIPITMEDAPKDEQRQYLVINFTKEGTMDDVFIAVHGIMDALYGNTVQDFVRKQKIIEFVERFRTAYNEKNITYLQTLFSNNAIIITGKVIKEKQNSDQVLTGNLSSERIEYVVQTKERYLERLNAVFTVNKYISVKFDEIEVTQHPRYPEIYGVTLKQEYCTYKQDNKINYHDIGYVFLMIDFKNEDEPLIHVRTWQPDKFKGETLPKEQRFTLDSFTRIAR